jgi:PKD repeat protein
MIVKQLVRLFFFCLSLIALLLLTSTLSKVGTVHSNADLGIEDWSLNKTNAAFVSGHSEESLGGGSDIQWSNSEYMWNIEGLSHLGGYSYAVAVQENHAFVGMGTGLTILDITNPADPAVVGLTPPLQGIVFDVVLQGNYAYLAVNLIHTPGGRLYIFDVSNPSVPTEVGFFETEEAAYTVDIVGKHAYVAAGGLHIIDITDPSHPASIGFYDTPGYAFGVAVSGNYAYVADGDAGMRIINVYNPAVPTEAGFYEAFGFAEEVEVVGNYAYVVAETNGIRIIDVSDFSNLTEKSVINSHCEIESVAVISNYAYVADGCAGLRVANIADPSEPIEIGFYNSEWYHDVAIEGDYAYIAAVQNGFRVINITDLTAPMEVSFYGKNYSGGVDVEGDYVYVANGSDGGLGIIDATDSAAPVEMGFLDTPGYANDLAVVENYAYIISGSGGLYVINVVDPTTPTEVGFLEIPGYASDVAVAGNYAFVANSSEVWPGLHIINVVDPTAPTEAGFFDTYPGEAHGVAVSGNYAYVAAWDKGLRIIDITDPNAPAETGYIDSFWYVDNVAVAGNFAYIAAGGDGLRIINVSDPSNPIEEGFFDTYPGEAHGVAVSGNHAYVVSFGSGLSVIDITDPASPIEVGFYKVPFANVAERGVIVYVTNNGLSVLRYSGDAPLGRIVVDKVTIPKEDPQAFSINLTGGPDDINEDFLLADADPRWDSEYLEPGVYTLTETLPSGWIQSNLNCDDGSDPWSIQLAVGETVICTFTNTKLDPPKADFSASVTNGVSPLLVTFDNLSTGDIDKCLWEFGDNNISDDCISPSHIYAEAGSFSVSLVATGPGGEDTITKKDYITVYEPVKADFSASPMIGIPPLEVDFTNLSTGDYDECLWNFGDGENMAICNNPKHKYKNEGHYTVSLTVKGAGGEDTKTIEKCVSIAYYRLFLPAVLHKK